MPGQRPASHSLRPWPVKSASLSYLLFIIWFDLIWFPDLSYFVLCLDAEKMLKKIGNMNVEFWILDFS
jgi:hypothetical protein